jgi:acyl-CoA thioesterase I
MEPDMTRRRLLQGAGASLIVAAAPARVHALAMTTVFTFGDSILDCGHYNAYGLTPGRLIVRNADTIFPEFKGRDLQARAGTVLQHRAVDGSTVADLAAQARGLNASTNCVALVTVGGNDLIGGLAGGRGAGVLEFERTLDGFIRHLPIRPALLGSVYDPTFGDDSRNFLNVDARLARANLTRVNNAIGAVAARYGQLVDLHAHFLKGTPSWFTHTIEPSLVGASEIRRVFLARIVPLLDESSTWLTKND